MFLISLGQKLDSEVETAKSVLYEKEKLRSDDTDLQPSPDLKSLTVSEPKDTENEKEEKIVKMNKHVVSN